MTIDFGNTIHYVLYISLFNRFTFGIKKIQKRRTLVKNQLVLLSGTQAFYISNTFSVPAET